METINSYYLTNVDIKPKATHSELHNAFFLTIGDNTQVLATKRTNKVIYGKDRIAIKSMFDKLVSIFGDQLKIIKLDIAYLPVPTKRNAKNFRQDGQKNR